MPTLDDLAAQLAALATRLSAVETKVGITPPPTTPPTPAPPAAPPQPVGSVLSDGRRRLDWPLADDAAKVEVRDEANTAQPLKDVVVAPQHWSIRSRMQPGDPDRLYTLVAIGPTGLRSDPSPALRVTAGDEPPPPPPPPAVPAATSAPGALLDLRRWYLTLPIADPSGRDSSGPWDVHQPELATFVHPDLFRTGVDVAGRRFVEYVCPASGPGVVTTSAESGAARDELRETNADGSLAAWAFADGRPHTLTCTLTCDGSSISGRKEVIVGQIHGPGGTPPLILSMNHGRAAIEVYRQGPRQGDLLAGLQQPGDVFTYRIDASGGRLRLWACTGTADQLPAAPTFDWPATVLTERAGLYFKAGAYLKEKLSTGASGHAVVRHYRLDLA